MCTSVKIDLSPMQRHVPYLGEINSTPIHLYKPDPIRSPQGYPEWALYRGRLRAPFREYAALLADVPPYEKVLAYMMPSLEYLAERWEQMTNAYVVEARPYWRYVCALLPGSRPSHMEKHGLILAASDPFWQKWYPLNGFGCRCAVVSLSPEEAREEGGVSRGYSFRYPEPDEGFAFNIGKELMG